MLSQIELETPQETSTDEREYQMGQWTRPAVDRRQGVGSSPFHRVEMTKRDWLMIETIAQRRIDKSNSHRPKRPEQLDPNQIAVFGEYMFAKALGLDSSEIYAGGSRRNYAFRWEIGTIAVKTTMNVNGTLNMTMPKDSEPRADFLVLCAKLHGDKFGGSIDGYCTRQEFVANRQERGIKNDWMRYTVPLRCLHPFYKFALMTINSAYIPLAEDIKQNSRQIAPRPD